MRCLLLPQGQHCRQVYGGAHLRAYHLGGRGGSRGCRAYFMSKLSAVCYFESCRVSERVHDFTCNTTDTLAVEYETGQGDTRACQVWPANWAETTQTRATALQKQVSDISLRHCSMCDFYGSESGLCLHKEADLVPGSPLLDGRHGSLQWKKLGIQTPKKGKNMPRVSLQSVFRLSKECSERLYAKIYIRFIFVFREVLFS